MTDPMTDPITRSWRIVRDLHHYFRAAEYPMGRVAAWVQAVKMRTKGWP